MSFNPGGANTILVVGGYGARAVRATAFDFGISVEASQDEGRSRRTMYTRDVVDTDFSVTIVSRNQGERQDLYNWFEAYGRALANPSFGLGAMRVLGPRGFDRMGIPKTGMAWGDTWNAVAYHDTIDFEPAGGLVAAKDLSAFVLPVNDTTDAPFFYPAGIQLGGSASADDVLYGGQRPDPDAVTKTESAPTKRF